MKRVMVRYTLKPGRTEENERYIKAVFAQLNETRPAGLGYASFKQPDGLSFVHIAALDGDENPLAALDAFKAFVKDIRDRCDEPPVAVDLTEIGDYELFKQR